MKRQIEFRGFIRNNNYEEKVVVNGEVFRGYWCYWNEFGVVVAEENCKDLYLSEHRCYYGIVEKNRVIPETVGQYVGIKDKNGKKVYEGDRVKVTYIEKRQYQGVPYDDEHCLTEEVFYSEENACFMLKVMCDDIPMYRPLHNFESLAKIKEIEVIGTIFDKESEK